MTDTPVIDTRQLVVRYGNKLAIDHLDLRLDPGRIHAIVGANGAGKSTLFRVLLGFQKPTHGSADILGCDSQSLSHTDRARIGFVNEEHTLPPWMSVAAVLRMQRSHYARWNQAAYDEVAGHYSIASKQKVGQLSRGERAGLNLALALAQSPELLILDEPTLGLDVVAKRAFLESMLYSREREGCTVVYCSHQMDEIERVADNLVIMERGALRHVSPPEEFCGRVACWIADMPFSGPDPALVPGLLRVQRIDGLHHYLVFDQGDDFGTFLREHGARSIERMPVGLDNAINGFLSRHHAMPKAA
jgi:ABC-2 type transport system ATP-binding protein